MASIILTIAAIMVILISVGLILAIVLLKKKIEGKTAEPDYHTFFLMGIVFVSVGIVFTLMTLLLDMSLIVGIPLFAMGIIYLVYGWENRDKWKK
ncbi:MAG: hypothetical protein ACFE7S_04125 [Candidatus Hodarchaeota archaeon]